MCYSESNENIILNTIPEGGDHMKAEYMTGKEIVNLINQLQDKGLSSDEIIDIIKYIETADPKAPALK